MDINRATEQAFKNGYEKGCKETAEKIFPEAIKRVQERFKATKGYTTCMDVQMALTELAKEQGVKL